MLWLRVLSAIIGIPILIFIVLSGGLWLATALFIIIVAGTYEFKNMVTKLGNRFLIIPVLIGETSFLIGAYFSWEYWFSFGIGISFILILIFLIYSFPNFKITDLSVNLLALIYIGWSFTHLLLLAQLPQGTYLIFFLFGVIWSTDTGAYFSGKYLGNKKLAPIISPKKTIAGAIGGLLFSLLFAVIFNFYLQIFSLLGIIIHSVIISTLGQIGDLVESSFKRMADVKDSGKIIPGHGGILDRFDSIIISAPVLFYLIIF